MRRHNRIAWALIGLRVAGNVLRSRRSHELMIVGAIMLAALAHQARENQTQILARLIAWDRRRRQTLRRQLREAGPAQDQVNTDPAQRAHARTELSQRGAVDRMFNGQSRSLTDSPRRDQHRHSHR